MNMNDAHARDHHHSSGDRAAFERTIAPLDNHITAAEQRNIAIGLGMWAYKRGWRDCAITIGAIAFALGILVGAAAVRLGLSL